MKKFKLSALVIPILSLGLACNGFVFASEESSEIIDFYENPYVTGFVGNATESEDSSGIFEPDSINWREEIFLSQYGETLSFLLNDLRNTISDWLPETAEEFTSLIFGENAEQFLKHLDSMVVELVKEEKLDEAGVMSEVCAMAKNAINPSRG